MHALPHFNLSPEDRATLARIGPIWGTDIAKHREITVGIYAKLHETATKSNAAIARDLAYGAHPRQVLDVFTPAGARDADVLVFVHGGAFVRGDKIQPGGLYENVLHWFAKQGLVGVNVEYRLGSEAPEPSGAEDVRDAVAWVRANIARYGGDPARIFVFGHSAGGTHAATFALDPRVRPAAGPGIAGLIIVSGRLRADTLPENPNREPVKIYFGPDESTYAARSPMAFADRCDMPLMVAIAEYENPLLDRYGIEFAWRVAEAKKRVPRFVRMTRHNHNSICAHFNTGEEILGREMLDFIARGF
jgi:acetyl esterase